MGGPPLVTPSRVKVGGLDRNEEGEMRETRLPEIAPRPGGNEEYIMMHYIYTEVSSYCFKSEDYRASLLCSYINFSPPPLAYIPTGTAVPKPPFSRQVHSPLPSALVSASSGLLVVNLDTLGIALDFVLLCPK